ncbi:unnamed protein product, partial [Iphiclides podalirius]
MDRKGRGEGVGRGRKIRRVAGYRTPPGAGLVGSRCRVVAGRNAFADVKRPEVSSRLIPEVNLDVNEPLVWGSRQVDDVEVTALGPSLSPYRVDRLEHYEIAGRSRTEAVRVLSSPFPSRRATTSGHRDFRVTAYVKYEDGSVPRPAGDWGGRRVNPARISAAAGTEIARRRVRLHAARQCRRRHAPPRLAPVSLHCVCLQHAATSPICGAPAAWCALRAPHAARLAAYSWTHRLHYTLTPNCIPLNITTRSYSRPGLIL